MSVTIAKQVQRRVLAAADRLDSQPAPEVAAAPPSTPAPVVEDADLAARKRTRRPFGSHQQKLFYPPRAGYHRHWFNDSPGRIINAQEAGYEHVKDDTGKNVVRPVGVNDSGGALMAYLMEIPEEWYKEDMAANQKANDEIDNAIKRGNVAGTVGEDGRYIPARGITIRRE